jgi:hypothetical protein
MYGVRRGADRVLVGRPEGRRPLERPKRRWEHNIKMDLQKWGACSGLLIAQDRDRWGGSCECGNEPLGSIKCGEFF